MRLRLMAAAFTLLALLLAACGTEDTAAPDGDGDTGTDTETDTADLELETEGQMRVGSDLNFPPFEFVEDGETKGFDIDLMDEVASRIGVEVEYVNANFDTIFTQLAAGEFDAIISGITITEERRQTIEFSDPYFAANQALVVLTDSEVTGVADLAGTDVGAQAGTTGLDYAQENFTESEVVEYPTYPAAFTALEAGQLDAVLADLPVAAEAVERSDTLQLVEEVDTGELYGIGVPHESPNLRAAISEALASIIDDGTYEEIYTRWFEGDVPEQFRR